MKKSKTRYPGVYRLPDKRWWIQVTATDPRSGKKVFRERLLDETMTIEAVVGVRAALSKEVREELQRQPSVESSRRSTVADYVVQWTATKAERLKPSTRDRYETQLSVPVRIVAAFSDGRPLQQLDEFANAGQGFVRGDDGCRLEKVVELSKCPASLVRQVDVRRVRIPDQHVIRAVKRCAPYGQGLDPEVGDLLALFDVIDRLSTLSRSFPRLLLAKASTYASSFELFRDEPDRHLAILGHISVRDKPPGVPILSLTEWEPWVLIRGDDTRRASRSHDHHPEGA